MDPDPVHQDGGALGWARVAVARLGVDPEEAQVTGLQVHGLPLHQGVDDLFPPALLFAEVRLGLPSGGANGDRVPMVKASAATAFSACFIWCLLQRGRG